jgi:archaellin
MLLDEIIDLSVDNKQPITTLLRKCIVLAHQLKNERLRKWANEELDGYDDIKNLPEYRILRAPATGLFVGPGWARFQQGIPSLALEKDHRESAEIVHIAQPVGTLEDTLKSGPDANLSFPWNANLVAYYQNKLQSGWQLFSAQQTIPKSAVTGIVDTVRTRVLNMALEIQSDVGGKDADLKEITAEESEKVDQTIVNNIYGGNVYLSGGNSTMTATTIQQQQQNIVAGDWGKLERVLKDAGITGPELKELSAAVEADANQKLKENGPVAKWIKAAAPKVLAGGVKMGVEVGKAVLTEMLMQYYGLK